jgi:molybdate transport system ATP-binding protein
LQDGAFRLGDRIVFAHTSWTLHRHEHWAILGANGSGKSLFADALRGRLPLVHGELCYHFRPPPGLSAEEAISHVSFEDRKADLHDTVVQSRWNSLEEEGALAVREFLSYDRVMEINPFEVTRRQGQARRQFERRMRRAVRLLQVAPLLGRALISLSNGERQKIQLARALAHPMRLLILDEPFAGLDTAARKHFHTVLERLMDTPLRVLLITTRAEDLPRHITHLLVVARCRVVAAGPRAGVLRSAGVRRLFSTQWVAGPPGPQQVPAATNRPADRLVRTTPPALHTPATSGVAPSASPIRRQERLRAGSPGSRRHSQPPNLPLPELVRMRNITVRYGKNAILSNVNWTIRAGESWALLGPNGAGKTTLLSLILGDNPQVYANEVVVFGTRRGSGESVWEIKRQIGWVSPELHLHFKGSATGFEVVASGFHDTVGLFQPPTARQRRTARRWLARFGLLEFARQPLHSLSTGLQRMVLLARALVKNPRLLILDEPCQGLDSAHRNLFVAAADALIRLGTVTAIYVTHRPDEIPPSITRVLQLRKQKLASPTRRPL